MRAGAAALALALALLALLAGGPAWAQGTPLEYAVKATYLYKFAPFVEWPATAFDSPSSPLHVCIAGDDPFGTLLDRAVSGQRVADHPVAVDRLSRVDRQSGCHILYVGRDGPQTIGEVLDVVRGTPVLTVTDQVRDPLDKGVVNFVLDSNRVRFEIDDRAAAENGLVISSKLLSLAISVRQRT